ncbi:MAG: alpha-L-fucosidase [Acidimicrobiales bacterium]
MADWFDAARLGLFVHWGPYSAARLEPSWPMVGGIPVLPNCQSLTVGEYDELTAGWAPPVGGAADWAALAAACGADYAVLTTKHHDGFTLFPSKFSAHGIQVTEPGRDLVGEFVTANREAGIRVGLYFSLPDWHHPSYPAFTDEMRPYPALGYPRPEPAEWEGFLADQRGQLDELLTNYGQIDLLWFDGGWERTADEWRASELKQFILQRQPGIITNDRCPGLPGYSSMMFEGVVPLDGGTEPWEACVPLDDSWGPLEHDLGRKSTQEVIGLLTDAAAGGGRLLLNISPLGDGSLMDWQRERLEGLALWIERNGQAIRGTEPSGLAPGQFYGPVTRSGEHYFLICPMRPTGLVVLRGVRGRRVKAARVLGSGAQVEFTLRISALERMLSKDPACDVLLQIGDQALGDGATVIELETEGGLS